MYFKKWPRLRLIFVCGDRKIKRDSMHDSSRPYKFINSSTHKQHCVVFMDNKHVTPIVYIHMWCKVISALTSFKIIFLLFLIIYAVWPSYSNGTTDGVRFIAQATCTICWYLLPDPQFQELQWNPVEYCPKRWGIFLVVGQSLFPHGCEQLETI